MRPTKAAEVIFKRDSVNVTGGMRGMLAGMDQIYLAIRTGYAPEQRMMDCPECGGGKVNTTWVDRTIEVKDMPDMVVNVPARTCVDCGFGFLDWQAEAIQDAALQEHFEKHGKRPKLEVSAWTDHPSKGGVKVATAVVGDEVSTPLPSQSGALEKELLGIEQLMRSAERELHDEATGKLIEGLTRLVNVVRRQNDIPYGTIVTGNSEPSS